MENKKLTFVFVLILIVTILFVYISVLGAKTDIKESNKKYERIYAK